MPGEKGEDEKSKDAEGKEPACMKKLQKKIEKKLQKAEEKAGRKPEPPKKRPLGTEDSTLTRTTGDASQEKYRCTYEARHLIMNYLDPASPQPLEMNWKGALVVKTKVHARLCNIDARGCWVQDEEYIHAGKRIMRVKGKSAGQVLKPYVELRKKHPEWFEDLEVYGQPCAVVDGVIMKWMLEEQAAAFPCSLWVRDMLAAGQGVQTRLVQALAQQIGARVYGGVTCLVQLTDTDYSWSFKAGVSAAQLNERQEQKKVASVKGERVEFKCGPREIVKIIYESQKAQDKRMEDKPWILGASRRNGMLHYRPDYLQGQLVEASHEAWAAELPEGSYRYPSRWLEERGNWVKDGKPVRADIQDIEDAEVLAAHLEAQFCQEEGYMQKVKSMGNLKLAHLHAVIEADEAEEELGASAADMMDPKAKRRLQKVEDLLKEKATAVYDCVKGLVVFEGGRKCLVFDLFDIILGG